MPLGSSLPARLPTSTGPVHYVSTTGDDSRTKAQAQNPATPWLTVQKLLDNLIAGDIGEVAAGTYVAPGLGRHELNARSGTSGSPITVRAAAGATVQMQPQSQTTGKEALIVKGGSSFWRFENLIFEEASTGAGTNYQNLYVTGASNDNEFYGCHIRYANQGTGYFIEEDCSRIHFYNCRTYENNQSGQQRQGGYITGTDCVVANCLFYGQTNGFGFQGRTNNVGGDGPGGLIVVNSVAYNNSLSGFMLESGGENCQFWNNISQDNDRGFRGLQASDTGSSPPTTANICRKNIAFSNTSSSLNNNSAVHWAFDFDGAGDHTGPGDNLTTDPKFLDAANANFRLTAGSSAIGYGNEAYCPAFDIDGTVRAGVDAGAYTYLPGNGVWFV